MSEVNALVLMTLPLWHNVVHPHPLHKYKRLELTSEYDTAKIMHSNQLLYKISFVLSSQMLLIAVQVSLFLLLLVNCYTLK